MDDKPKASTQDETLATTFANEDGLEMYFEQRRSGGGEDVVESVVMLGDSSAKITFINPSGM